MPRRSTQSDNTPKHYNLETIQAPNLLLVEGPDEFQFFRFIHPRDDVQIHVYEGKNQLKSEIETLYRIEGFNLAQKVAMVRDADHDPDAALQSVLTQWANAFKVTMPRVQSDQWFADQEGRQWSVWIMPGPDRKGDLEELLWQAVKPGDHHTCVENLIGCLDNCNPIPFGSKTKARLYAWLATQRDPLKGLHEAFMPNKGLFDATHEAFARFNTLLSSL